MEKLKTLLRDAQERNIVGKHSETKLLKQLNSYNLFSLSTYTSHLENFHSDVIASLLNNLGLHEEGPKFLNAFVQFLNIHHNYLIDINNYKEYEVTREKGRIDIWIKNRKTGRAIVIENKINNALDRLGQIEDYFDYSQQNGKCKVDAIIYLTLDGLKTVPSLRDDVSQLTSNVGAFTNKSDDLVSGWLSKCLEISQENFDTASLLNQYIKLLKHLSSHKMDINTLDEFYSLVNTKDTYESMKILIQLNSTLPKYRMDRFVNEIKDYKPFKTCARWQPNYTVYDHYSEGLNSFKIDIHFMLDVGNASILFWNPPHRNESGFSALTKKLRDCDLLGKFEVYDTYMYAKFFRLDEYETLKNLDQAICDYTKNFMRKLKQSISNA